MKRFLVGLVALLAATLGLVAVPTTAAAVPPGAEQATVGVLYAYTYGAPGTGVSGLPPGLRVNDDGSVTGTPTTPGEYPVLVDYPVVCNPDGTQCSAGREQFVLTVAPAPAGPARADLRIDPIDAPDTVTRGSTVGVGITAENLGPSPTTRTYLVLTIPAGFSYVGTDVFGDPTPTARKYGSIVVVSVPRLAAAVPGQLTPSRFSALVELKVGGAPRRTALVAATGSAVRDRELANNIAVRSVRVT